VSLLDLCDTAYVLLVEQLERRTLVERQVAAVLRAADADVEEPDAATARERFDAALIAAPVPESPNARLLRELGVG